MQPKRDVDANRCYTCAVPRVATLEIDVWSDLVCPWCYLGKRRLERALVGYRSPVLVRWRAFQLDPSAPRRANMPLTDLLERKYGMARADIEASQARLVAQGREVGIEFNFDLAQSGNTRDAHRLLAFAAGTGRADALLEALMRAYFTEGVPIGEVDALVTVAVSVGLDAGTCRAALAGEEWHREVDDDLRRARQHGIRGVPYFMFDGRDSFSGAQPEAALRAALDRVTVV